jgi:hypothetical protein
MKAWLWQVWPRPAWLLTVFLLHAGWVGGISFLLWFGSGLSWQDIRGVLETTPAAVPTMAAGIYAIYRVFTFHPGLRPDYRAWLRQTPWSHRQPLPYGPVHLVLQDAILLGLTVAVTAPFYGERAAGYILLAFVIVYLWTLLAALLTTYEWPAAYAVLFGLAAFIPAWREGWYLFGLAAATYLTALAGLRRSYRRFPREQDIATAPEAVEGPRLSKKAAGQPLYGWPFNLLGPPRGMADPPFWHSLTCCCLVGWWLFAILSTDARERGDWNCVSVNLTVIVTCLAGLVRLVVYQRFEFMPPLSLAGRLATGRWIIPGYDQLFAAPFCGSALAFVLPNALVALGANTVVSNCVSLPVCLLAVVTLPPSRRRWFLTGDHRIVCPAPLDGRPPQMV